MLKIRLMSEQDLDAMHTIYAHYVKETPITLEYEVPSFEDWKSRFVTINQNFPGLVCLQDEKIIGYSYASRLHTRIGYSWTAESTIYLDHTTHSKGIGKILYTTLIEILQVQGFTSVVGTVTMPNIKSEKLHLSLGFQVIGNMEKVGRKFENWYDVKYFQLFINNINSRGSDFPTPVKSLPEHLVNNILSKQLPI